MLQDRFGLVPEQIRASYEQSEAVERHANAAKALRAALKAHDPHLSVVWVRDLPEEHRPAGTLPGRWHVERQNPGPVLPSYFPITTPEGGYRYPDSSVLDEIRSRDMWRDGALDQALRRREKDAKRREKDKALKSEQRKDEMALDVRAGKRVAGENLHKRRWGAH